jgi:hypothetical protein
MEEGGVGFWKYSSIMFDLCLLLLETQIGHKTRATCTSVVDGVVGVDDIQGTYLLP